MTATLSFWLAQANFIVGDLAGNKAKILSAYAKAEAAGADLVVCPEMCLTGYPPEDLVLRGRFQQAAMETLNELVAQVTGRAALLAGGIWREGSHLYNTAFLIENGAVIHRQYKHRLPNYGVFDEHRVFASGPLPTAISWRGIKLGLLICEDMWNEACAKRLKSGGAEIILSLNASPYEMGKARLRREMVQARVAETGLPFIYVNQTGGQDELVFDGRSFAVDAGGSVRLRLRSFDEDEILLRLAREPGAWRIEPSRIEPPQDDMETVYHAMVLGLRDYVGKNGFPGIVLGLSGGMDSALTAAVAVDAIGAERVRALMMPSPYTSRDSLDDAADCADRLNIRLDSIPITQAMEAMEAMLAPLFTGRARDATEENIQSRLRGNLLMSVSNKESLLVVTTGNKSEMSVGYATLYGDMCGGYSVLKDVYKTTVYRVARWRNRMSDVIPERIFTKAPSAELRPDQTDQDSLPPYDILDGILVKLVEEQRSVAETVAAGYERATVLRVAKLLYNAEYKRRQSPPGVKITGMSFGRDRRYPLTSYWRE